MRHGLFVLAILLPLAACGDDPVPAVPERIADPEARADVLPVMGQERRIAVLATGMLDGRGLAPEETYPARLENALRVRGVNARLITAASAQEAAASGAELMVAAGGASASKPAAKGLPIVFPRMEVPPALRGPDGVRPVASGVEELVGQSVDQVAAALPPRY